MTDWILSVEGTAEAGRIALMLALVSAFAHAIFGALQKSRYGPWESRGAIDLFVFVNEQIQIDRPPAVGQARAGN